MASLDAIICEQRGHLIIGEKYLGMRPAWERTVVSKWRGILRACSNFNPPLDSQGILAL